jgi:hypothetical protein
MWIYCRPCDIKIMLYNTRNLSLVRFEVLTVVVIKSTIFWDITPCSPLRVNRRFGGTYRLHLQCRKTSRAWNQSESRWQAELCFHAGFLLGLFFDPEDRGDMFLRNVGWLSTDYTALYHRIWYSSIWVLFVLKPISFRNNRKLYKESILNIGIY